MSNYNNQKINVHIGNIIKTHTTNTDAKISGICTLDSVQTIDCFADFKGDENLKSCESNHITVQCIGQRITDSCTSDETWDSLTTQPVATTLEGKQAIQLTRSMGLNWTTWKKVSLDFSKNWVLTFELYVNSDSAPFYWLITTNKDSPNSGLRLSYNHQQKKITYINDSTVINEASSANIKAGRWTPVTIICRDGRLIVQYVNYNNFDVTLNTTTQNLTGTGYLILACAPQPISSCGICDLTYVRAEKVTKWNGTLDGWDAGTKPTLTTLNGLTCIKLPKYSGGWNNLPLKCNKNWVFMFKIYCEDDTGLFWTIGTQSNTISPSDRIGYVGLNNEQLADWKDNTKIKSSKVGHFSKRWITVYITNTDGIMNVQFYDAGGAFYDWNSISNFNDKIFYFVAKDNNADTSNTYIREMCYVITP